MISKRTLWTSMIWSTVETWGGRVLSMLTIIVLARLLAPEDFGVVAAAMLYISFLQIFLEGGFHTAIIQYEDLQERHKNTVFTVSLVVALLFTIATWFVAPLTVVFMEDPLIVPVLRALSGIFLIYSFSSVAQALLKREMKFKHLATRRLIANIAGTITGIVLALQGYGVWSLVVKQLVDSCVSTVFLFATSAWKPRLDFSPGHLQDLWSYSMNQMGSTLVAFASSNMDRIIIAGFLGPYALGLYSICQRLLGIIGELLTQTLRNVLLPALSRLQTDIQRLQKLFFQSVSAVAWVSAPVYLTLILWAGAVIPLLYGDQWDESIPVLQYLVPSRIFLGIGILNLTLLLATGLANLQLRLNILGLLTSLIAVSIGQEWGITGVAAGMSVHSAALQVIVFYYTARKTGYSLRRMAVVIHYPLISSLFVAAGYGLGLFYFPLQQGHTSELLLITAGGLIVHGLMFYRYAEAEMRLLSEGWRALRKRRVKTSAS